MAFDKNETIAIKHKLEQHIIEVLDALGCTEIRKSPCKARREFKVPWHSHGEASIYLSGDKIGGWLHWSGGDSGDLIGLIGAMVGRDTKDYDAAFKWAKRFFGWDKPLSAKESQEFNANMAHRAKLAELDAKARLQSRNRDLNKARRAAKMMFLNPKGEPRKARRLEHGDRVCEYLQARGIDLEKIGLPGAIRFWPRHDFTDVSGAKIKFDCMIAGMYLPDGNLAAVHRTWLSDDQLDKKAPIFDAVKPEKSLARKIWPEYVGAFIPIWKGASGKSRRLAKPVSETILICEGIEDGLTHAMWRPDCRIDVCGSLSNMNNYCPPPSAREIIIAADRDWGKEQVLKQLEKLARRLADIGQPSAFRAANFKVKILYPPEGYKDFNDALLRKRNKDD